MTTKMTAKEFATVVNGVFSAARKNPETVFQMTFEAFDGFSQRVKITFSAQAGIESWQVDFFQNDWEFGWGHIHTMWFPHENFAAAEITEKFFDGCSWIETR